MQIALQNDKKVGKMPFAPTPYETVSYTHLDVYKRQPVANRIIEIGAVRVKEGSIVDRFSVFVNPQVPIPFKIEQLTGINDSMVVDAETIEEVLPKFLEFSKGAVMVAHNAGFDMSFIIENCKRLGIEQDFTYVDTVGPVSYTHLPCTV